MSFSASPLVPDLATSGEAWETLAGAQGVGRGDLRERLRDRRQHAAREGLPGVAADLVGDEGRCGERHCSVLLRGLAAVVTAGRRR